MLRYGVAAAADVAAEDLELDVLGRPSFTLRTPAGTERVELPITGEHMAHNALAAAAVGVALGLSPSDCAAGLKDARVSPWRMELLEGRDGITDPQRRLQRQPDVDRRRAEGGASGSPAAAGASRSWGRWRSSARAPMSITSGSGSSRCACGSTGSWWSDPEPARIAAGAMREGVEPDMVTTVEDVAGAAAAIRAIAREGDVVLLKGSRVAGLERLAEVLR